VRFRIREILTEAEQEHWSVIIHPATSAMIIQLDDLREETVNKIRPHALLVTRTSPGNHQVWIAVADSNTGELARRLKRGTGADTNANGAGKIAGGRNWKPTHWPTFPVVVITYSNPGYKSNWHDLEADGFVASIAPPATSARVASCPDRMKGATYTGLWPDYNYVRRGAPRGRYSSGPDLGVVDAFWCKLGAKRGHSLRAIADELIRVSKNAQEQIARGNENYALDKARWGVEVTRR
jgi:hypothetical protein